MRKKNKSGLDISNKGLLLNYGEISLVDLPIKENGTIEINAVYDMIGCQKLDCRSINNTVDIWVDDEGFLKDDKFVQSYLYDGKVLFQPFAGNCLVLNNRDGDTFGLSKSQIRYLLKYLRIDKSDENRAKWLLNQE